jgi:hypothetical protein
MIDLEDPQRLRPRRLAIGKGVQSCSQQNVLARSIANRFCETIFGKSATHHKTRFEPHPGRFRQTRQELNAALVGVALCIDEAGTNRVIQNLRLAIEFLMEGAHYRSTLGSGTRSFFFHSSDPYS